MKRIKYLPGSVHSSLRSSIFLFDLTRVVEELTLNSLDAGATKVYVSVNVREFLIKVEDNGFGITRDGLLLLGKKYATSKVQSISGMDDDVGSLSCRGEALSSLSDISLLEIISKACGRPNAYRKVMKSQKCLFLGIDERRQEVGTTVIARDLFYNQPVRRRFLQSRPKKTLNSIKRSLFLSALVHPQVSFHVLDLESENQLLHTLPSPSPLPLLSNNFGEISHRLHEVSYSNEHLELSGYLSGPTDTFSVKAFQYLYVNSRYVCRGPIHKMINNLASSLCSPSNHNSKLELRKGKRQRVQGCPAYMLNLQCPLCSYDLTFEASETVVEFKDWDSVLSFVEKAVWHIWRPLCASPLLGESDKSTNNSHEGLSGEDLSTTNAFVSTGMSDEGYVSHVHRNLLSHGAFSCSKEMPLKELSTCNSQIKSSRRWNGKTLGNEMWKDKDDFCQQIDDFPKIEVFNPKDVFGFKNDETISPFRLCRERQAFKSQDMSSFDHSKIGYSKCRSHPPVSQSSDCVGSYLLSDQYRRFSKKDDSLLDSDDERDIKNDSKWNRLTQGLKHFQVENVQADLATFSDLKLLELEFDKREYPSPFDPHTYYGGKYFETGKKNRCREKVNQFQSHFGSIMSCVDKKSCSKLSSSMRQFATYNGPYCPKQTSMCHGTGYRNIQHSGVSHLSYLDESPGSPISLSNCHFVIDDWHDNVRSERNDNLSVGSASKQNQTFELGDNFKDDFQNASRKVFMKDCGDDDLCIKPAQMMRRNCSDKIKIERDACAEMNFEGAWLNSNYPMLKIRSNHDTQPVEFPETEYVNEIPWETFQYGQLSQSFGRRSRRSSSAPPFCKQKSKYSTIYDYSKNIKARDQQGRNSDNDDTLTGNPCTFEDELEPCGSSSSFAQIVSNDKVGELLILDKTWVDKRISGTEVNVMQTSEGSDKNASVMEYSNTNMTKWRDADLYSTSMQIKSRSNRNSEYDDGILDIWSGVLHLAGGLLVPESISRDSLEDAKVLLQVDRKFIFIVASGILVAIDQHAADERIRLEDLRQKVMIGDGCSIHHLHVEQELMLPEMGLQLILNYGEQIKKWGWICSSNLEFSGTFSKNLNLLKKKSCRIDLLAVPCILGVNLTDRDLLEYLEQLADTDGASTLPPSVLRVLNFKACRGAIMFGDALLPSECSLIVDELKKTSLCFQCAHGRPTCAPLVNMVELHRHLAKLETNAEGRIEVLHGLQRHVPSLERAQERLSSAKRFRKG